ncbi:DsrE family protein [Chitinophaga sp. 212800010-3]|uniref:DsrE family protein n=1 Tax=unclassified Chitinophaga TaxID=2619133 RepID=UPI002DE8EF4B|nr:DrsE domain-containing protein [Chitinophaga sp. 212800010-3]
MEAVFQITSGERDAQSAMLGQLRNLLRYTDETNTRVAVEVVVHGQAWTMLLAVDNPQAAGVQELHQRGIRFLICRNTMNSHQLELSLLFPFVEVIPAGVVHLIMRQQEGWGYIRG